MRSSRKILLIAADPDLVRRITESLSRDPLPGDPGPPLDVRSLSGLAQAAAACEAQAYDLLLLDLATLAGGGDLAEGADTLLLNPRAPLVGFRGGADLAGLRQAVAEGLARGRHDPRGLRRALYDDFTGLPTRALLIDLINQAVARARRSGLYVALVPFTLRGLERCEGRFAPPKVEKIYKALIERLTGSLRSSDVVAHFGGADFAILMEIRNGYDDAVLVAERVREIMTDSFVFGEVVLDITMTLRGPVLCDSVVDDLEPLLRRAESADRISATAA